MDDQIKNRERVTKFAEVNTSIKFDLFDLIKCLIQIIFDFIFGYFNKIFFIIFNFVNTCFVLNSLDNSVRSNLYFWRDLFVVFC